MQQPQRRVKQVHQIPARHPSRAHVGSFFKLQPRLDQLQIPIAKLSPEKVINPVSRLVKPISLQSLVHIRRNPIEPRKNPPILQRLSIEPSNAHARTDPLLRPPRPKPGLNAIHIHEHKSRRIPDLISECPIPLRPALVECNIGPRRSHRRQRKPRSIRPKPLNNVQRIDHVPLSLRHLLPLGIPHQRMNINMPEGHAVVLLIRLAIRLLDNGILLMPLHEVAPKHDHPRQPEEQNVEPGDHQRVGIEHLQITRLLRPSQSRKRQQPGREPCIEHVRNLLQLRPPALTAFARRLARNDHFLTPRASPCRNPMSPPKLARNAPVIDVRHPVQINLPEVFRDNRDLARLHRRLRPLRQRLDLDEPLLR